MPHAEGPEAIHEVLLRAAKLMDNVLDGTAEAPPAMQLWADNADMVEPLVAWLKADARFLRRNSKYMHGDFERIPSVVFARLLLREV